jgi:hypothetical protein
MPIVNIINKVEVGPAISGITGDLSITGALRSSGERAATIEDAGLSLTVDGRFLVPPPFYPSVVNYVQIISGNTVLPVTTNNNLWLENVSYTVTDTTLSGITFNNLYGVRKDFTFASQSALTGLNLPLLTMVGGAFSPGTMAALTSFSLPQLTTVGGSFSPSTMGALTSFSVPQLTTVGGNFNPTAMAALTGMSLPQLRTVGGIAIDGASIRSIELPQLTTVGSFIRLGGLPIVNPTPRLTGLSLPAITGIGGNIDIFSTGLNFSGLFFGTGLRNVNGNLTVTGQALSIPSVENILVRLAALNGTSGTTVYGAGRSVALQGGTSAGSGVLTPAASAARAVLTGRSVVVTLNP